MRKHFVFARIGIEKPVGEICFVQCHFATRNRILKCPTLAKLVNHGEKIRPIRQSRCECEITIGDGLFKTNITCWWLVVAKTHFVKLMGRILNRPD
jgi:hypothetical protein